MKNSLGNNNLRKQFPEIYTKLFSEYELILSGHFGFNRFPTGLGHTSHYISIKQKVASKCYVGIRKVSQPGITIDDILMYDGKEFIKYEQEKLVKHYDISIQQLQTLFNLEDKEYGYHICIVAESSRGEGLGFSGTIFTLITAGVGILSGKYEPNVFDDYEKFEKGTYFHEIKSIAHECTWLAKKGNPGSAFYTTMLPSAHPHVYISEDHENIEQKDIPYMKEYYQNIPSMLHLTDVPFTTLPVRRAMIYTGQRANTLLVESQKNMVESQNREYSDRFRSRDREKIKTNLHGIFSKHSYYDVMIEALDAMSSKTLYLFAQIYKQGPRKEYIHELIEHLNTIHSVYNDIEDAPSFINDFFDTIASINAAPSRFGISPIYTGKHGGNYIVVFEDENDLQVLENIIEELSPNYPYIRIAHYYDFDNPPAQGIRVEQNIFENTIGEHNNDTYIMIDNFGHQSFCKYSDIKPTETKGLFLDAVKSKVYLNGKALTSKDIKSQTTTIEIFDHILQDAEYTIKNNQLGPSTFSGQQNQMLGKIIYPLTKLVQKEIGKEFPLECTGSLREFWIKLGKTDIPVVLIKKI